LISKSAQQLPFRKDPEWVASGPSSRRTASGCSRFLSPVSCHSAIDHFSRLVFTILSAVAEAERHRIAERIKDIKADQRQRGRFLDGATPFGYRKTGMGASYQGRASSGRSSR
jgi:hypothetical protein